MGTRERPQQRNPALERSAKAVSHSTVAHSRPAVRREKSAAAQYAKKSMEMAAHQAIADYYNWQFRLAHAKPRDPKRAAKRKARQMGLSYWPALLFEHYAPQPARTPEADRRNKRRRYICDPRAFVAAEAVLKPRKGIWGQDSSHGGFDSYGVWGMNAQDVAHCWWAAGCADTPKFRVQVAAFTRVARCDDKQLVAKKGDTLPWLKNYYRGLAWLSSNKLLWLNLGRKTVAVLGRLSPELRRVALSALIQERKGQYGEYGKVVRVRHLDWDAVQRVQEQLKSGHVKVRAALAGLNRAAALLGVDVSENAVAEALAPHYPGVPLAVARRLALGEAPVQISEGALTAAEAHQWMMAGAPPLAEWLVESVGRQLGRKFHMRSVRVARWIQSVGANPARRDSLTRTRTAQAPGGQVRQFSALDVLDEVQDRDIVTGKDSVTAVLERAAQRLGEAWMTEQMADHRQLAPMPEWARKLPRGVRLLNTPAQLAREGKEMAHCVGGYRDAVSSGQSFILALATRQGRSTAELLPSLKVQQHKAVNNGHPCRRNEWLLQAFLRRISKKGGR